MAIGCIFIIFLFKKNRILKIIYSKYIQIFTLFVLTVFIIKGITVPYVNYEFYALLFGILIVNLAANKKSILNLENNVLHYLGKISYGLYMYHPIAIMITLKALYSINISNIYIQILMSVSLTVFIAGVSYKYFESYFIKKKNIFTKIVSGEEAI